MKLSAKFQFSLITISYLSLLLGFYLGEDTVGGMEHDYNLIQVYLIAEEFKDGLNNFLFFLVYLIIYFGNMVAH